MPTSIGVSPCCLSGKVHDGTPTGEVETIGGLQTYVAEPQDGSREKTVIFLVDIFGWKFNNVRLLADNYAKAGFYAYVPDIHQGDSLPVSFLHDVEPTLLVREIRSTADKVKSSTAVAATLGPWLVKHHEGITKPLIDHFITAVKQIPGTGKVGAIGFCWGGRYVILKAADNIDAGYACHPALLSIPEDLEGVTKPLSVAVGDKDSLLDKTVLDKIIDVLAKKTDVPHEIRVYEGQIHGFTLRSDWSNTSDKKAMDDAEKQGIGWFNEYLAA